MQVNRPLLTYSSFAALGLNGVAFMFLGVSLPSIQTRLDITIEQTGLLTASLQTGFTIFTLIGGLFADRVRREWILMLGCLLLGTGSALLCTMQSYTISLLLFSVMGAGIGLILSGSNTLLVSLYPDHKGTILNIHHVFFGLGAVAGPALMGFLIIRGEQYWRAGYVGMSSLLFVLCSIFAFFKNKVSLPTDDGAAVGSGIISILNDGKFMIILLVNFLTVGSQVVVMLFGTTFLIQVKQCSYGEAGAALSAFSLLMVAGRMICSRLAITLRNAKIILGLLWFQVLMLLLIWQGSGWFSITVLALCGITFSGTYPTLLALTSVLYPRRQGAALGVLSTTGGLGSIILCWMTGYVAGLTSFNTGFMVTILACSGALILFQMNYQSLGKREAHQQEIRKRDV